MKCNDLMILFVLVSGIFIGAGMHSTISRQKYKTDMSKQALTESVYDSRFTGFEWRSHKYLKYMDSVNAFSTILHDPDCPCWTNKVIRAEND